MVAARNSNDLIWTLFQLCWFLYSSFSRQHVISEMTGSGLRLSSSQLSSPNRKRTCGAKHLAACLREDANRPSLTPCVMSHHWSPAEGMISQCFSEEVWSRDWKPPGVFSCSREAFSKGIQRRVVGVCAQQTKTVVASERYKWCVVETVSSDFKMANRNFLPSPITKSIQNKGNKKKKLPALSLIKSRWH